MTHFTPNTEGVFLGLDEKTYRDAPGLAQSTLKHMDPTPAHCLAYMQGEKPAQTKAMQLGTLAHRLILEPKNGIGGVAVRPEGMDFRTKVGKDWRDEQLAGGLEIITAEEYRGLFGMAKSVAEHPFANQLLSSGNSEVAIFSKMKVATRLGNPNDFPILDTNGNAAMEECEVFCKGRLDFLPLNGNMLVDVKTCEDASPREFERQIRKMQYHCQAAWYLDLWNSQNPNTPRDLFAFIAVEKARPFCVAVYFISAKDIEAGRQINQRRAAKYAECSRLNHWPGYSEGWTEISLTDRW